MIVIAIIGILAAIAIPNFIAYRDKAFCSAAENDASNVAAAIADYFAVPNKVTLPTVTDSTTYTTWANKPPLQMSSTNEVTVAGDVDAVTISVTDMSGRCPDEYQTSQAPAWDGNNVFTKTM
jgi:Tfp pilus assembly protein PilE